MPSAISCSELPEAAALDLMSDDNRSVSVNPGRILFTVIPNSEISADKVLAQEATAHHME